MGPSSSRVRTVSARTSSAEKMRPSRKESLPSSTMSAPAATAARNFSGSTAETQTGTLPIDLQSFTSSASHAISTSS
eukprot:15730_2